MMPCWVRPGAATWADALAWLPGMLFPPQDILAAKKALLSKGIDVGSSQ